MLDEPLVRDLLRPENLPGPDAPVELKSTHASAVFLKGDAVFKVKRARDYGFFDYTTREARRYFCNEEVRLNRRAAPDVYLGVVPVYRDERGHSLTRPGEIVDYAVWMRRLPDAWSARARVDTLDHDDLDAIARRVAEFYRHAEKRPDTPETLRINVRENFAGVEPFVGRFVDRALFEETRDAQWAWLEARDPRLAARTSRDGHGDLRLEHVYLTPGGVLLIDCVEFLPRFRIADPALDVAFLAMDLMRLGRADQAQYFLGRFAYESDDYDFFPLIDGYLSYRAWVRAKVACLVAADPSVDADTAARKAREADLFFRMARYVMRPRTAAALYGVGGVIGSGKTTFAASLSRRTGAVPVSADATRKYLAGRSHEEVGPPGIYLPSFTARVHDEILRRADEVLASGRPVAIDTTFGSRRLRVRARALAHLHRAPFVLYECTAPEATIRERLRSRAEGVSDARAGLYERLVAEFEPVVELEAEEHVVVDTSVTTATELCHERH